MLCSTALRRGERILLTAPGIDRQGDSHQMSATRSDLLPNLALRGAVEQWSAGENWRVAANCCITYEPFKEPVVASDGHTYERIAIAQWLQQTNVSPLTRAPLDLDPAGGGYRLIPNHAMRALADCAQGLPPRPPQLWPGESIRARPQSAPRPVQARDVEQTPAPVTSPSARPELHDWWQRQRISPRGRRRAQLAAACIGYVMGAGGCLAATCYFRSRGNWPASLAPLSPLVGLVASWGSERTYSYLALPGTEGRRR